MKNLKKIGLIGCGEVGSLLLAQLNMLLRDVQFYILDHNLEHGGKYLDLKHALIHQNNALFFNEHEGMESIDLLFYAAGVPNPPGIDRSVMAHQNKSIIESIFKTLQFKQNIPIIVLANPVEASCFWIDQVTQQMHFILGTGTLLDTYRLRALIPEEKQALVLGEHGPKMFILQESINTKDFQWDAWNQQLKGLATEIRRTEMGTKYGVVASAIQLMQNLANLKDFPLPYCRKINDQLQQLLKVNHPIYVNHHLNAEKFAELFSSFSSKDQAHLMAAAQQIEKLSLI